MVVAAPKRLTMNYELDFQTEPFGIDLERHNLGRSGRWIQHGNTIVALPDTTTSLSEGQDVYELSGGSISSATPRVLTYSTKGVIDKRISVPAQHSLVRLSKNPATSADAVGMLEEVKVGRLEGIYCVNWQKPAQRTLRFGKTWWTVIPPGEDAVLMLDPNNPAGGQSLIAFRRGLDPDCGLLKGEKRYVASPSRLDAALLKAWTSYRLWQTGQLAPCSQVPGLPVRNIMPPGLFVPCQPITITEGTLGEVSTRSAVAAVDVVKPKLSFFQNFEDYPAHTVGFKNLADRQAKRISAFGEPYQRPCENVEIGSTSYTFGGDIINAIESVHRCLSKPVEEVHIFGHSGTLGLFGGRSSRKWGLYVNDAGKCPLFEREHTVGARIVDEIPTAALATNAIFLLHGCKTALRRPKRLCFEERCVTRRGAKTCECLCEVGEGPGIAQDLLQVLLRGGCSEAKVFGHAVFGDSPGAIGRNEDWWVFSSQNPGGRRAKPGEVPYRQ
jgi:hypothetical protein